MIVEFVDYGFWKYLCATKKKKRSSFAFGISESTRQRNSILNEWSLKIRITLKFVSVSRLSVPKPKVQSKSQQINEAGM